MTGPEPDRHGDRARPCHGDCGPPGHWQVESEHRVLTTRKLESLPESFSQALCPSPESAESRLMTHESPALLRSQNLNMLRPPRARARAARLRPGAAGDLAATPTAGPVGPAAPGESQPWPRRPGLPVPTASGFLVPYDIVCLYYDIVG